MQPFSRDDAPSNFSVAGQALEGGLSGREFMTIRAVGYPIDRLVGPGKRTGRDLPRSRNRDPQDTEHKAPENSWLRKVTNSIHQESVHNRSFRFDNTEHRSRLQPLDSWYESSDNMLRGFFVP